MTFEELQAHAAQVVRDFADPAIADNLRQDREVHTESNSADKDGSQSGSGALKSPAGDMVFENAVLFMRDALLLREFAGAVGAGGSGCIVTAIKLLALAYRDSGRAKYAHESLDLIHHNTHVWMD